MIKGERKRVRVANERESRVRVSRRSWWVIFVRDKGVALARNWTMPATSS